MAEVKITLVRDDEIRDLLRTAHLVDMAASEALEGDGGWMFLAGMLAMKAFCADGVDELEQQGMLTEKVYEIASGLSGSQEDFKGRLKALSDAMCSFVEEKARELDE